MLTGGYGNNSFFSQDVLDSFTAPKSTDQANWGRGWWREADFERVWYFGTQSSSRAFGHQGWTGTLAIVDPERDLVVVYLTNKINSPLADRTKNLNKFSGSCYTSATLGFVSEILSVGMDSDTETDVKEQLLDLCADMARGSLKLISDGMREDHPQILNAKAKADLLKKEMDKTGSDKYRDLVKEMYGKTGGSLGDHSDTFKEGDDIILGDERFDEYLPKLSGKRVAIFSNHTGIVGDDTESNIHIVDALLEKGAEVTCVFAPEHGFRGNLDAGATVKESVDEETGLPIYPADSKSLLSMSDSRMAEFDTLIVDIQDVGLRFYTYYVSMYYLMQTCGKYGKSVVILDRPNPNGFYIDGPILEEGFRSNVGLLPIPVVHGLTLGELAKMILGEGWLGAGGNCDLTVIPCENYTHSDLYEIKTAPSPNLKTMEAIYLYPSTCLFENTLVSPGRGTENPFAIFGSPYLPDNPDYDHIFITVSMEGAKNPPFEGEECFGKDLSDTPILEL
ncbi:MAG: DUF1343 domain-containing protein, partial [Lachnospiraceae bacterium]|nr:DUF1343 domain-containing protein [Lachnospiraceae bacterium]